MFFLCILLVELFSHTEFQIIEFITTKLSQILNFNAILQLQAQNIKFFQYFYFSTKQL